MSHIGHNQLDQHQVMTDRVAQLVAGADIWRNRGNLETEELESKAGDFKAQVDAALEEPTDSDSDTQGTGLDSILSDEDEDAPESTHERDSDDDDMSGDGNSGFCIVSGFLDNSN